MKTESRINLQLLAARIANRASHRQASPICFLLGAGADISSGGLTFNEFKRRAVSEILSIPIFRITSDETVDAHFQELFSRATPYDRALLTDQLFHAMADLSPSDAYKLLVLLADTSAIDAIITTNFDVMLEAAASQLALDIFQILTPATAKLYLFADNALHGTKKPYIKLHGDLKSRNITHITTADLETNIYELNLLSIIQTVLLTHDLVILGYSGNDPALATHIDQMTSHGKTSIFWCNKVAPASDSKLFSLIKDRCHIIELPFDDLIIEIARPVLEKPTYAPEKANYIRQLFEWRVAYSNTMFMRDYAETTHSALDYIIHRQYIEERLFSFLASDRHLAIVTGPSGFGKTTLGVSLWNRWKDHKARKIILFTSKSLVNPDLELHLTERLGGLGPPAPVSIRPLETWLRTQQLQLIVFLDAINEYSADLNACSLLLRNIVRLCYYLPDGKSSIKLIATVRQETWHSLLPRIEIAALRHSLWTGSEVAESISTLTIGPLTDTELREALSRASSCENRLTSIESLSQFALDKLRDPFLLGAILKSNSPVLIGGPTLSTLAELYDDLLKNNMTDLDAVILEDSLSRLALLTVERGQDFFRPVDVEPLALRSAIERASKDLGILYETSDGYLRFRHDRLQEYFIALSFELPESPRIVTSRDLQFYLECTVNNPKARSALRQYLISDNGVRLKVIEEALLLDSKGDQKLSILDRAGVLFFIQEVIYELTENFPDLAEHFIAAAIQAILSGKVGTTHLRALIQSASSLPDDLAVATLSSALNACDDLPATEANIFLVDKLLRSYLLSDAQARDFSTSSPYKEYFQNPTTTPWRRIGRTIRFLSQAGWDNLHPDEHKAVTEAMRPVVQQISKLRLTPSDIDSFAHYYKNNTDRLLFNATKEDIDNFFANSDRSEFSRILVDLENGEILNNSHLEYLNPYIRSMDFSIKPYNLEYNICTLLYILSAQNDIARTIELWESRFRTFSDLTPAVEIDFYQGVLVSIHVIFSLEYDLRFSSYEEQILRDWPTVLACKPGFARGFRRGFRDEFDMIFEDGFSVIYPYGYLMPSLRRRRMRMREYQRDFTAINEQPLSLYSRYLEKFLNNDQSEFALQILHALNDIIVTWPTEGLLTLRDAVGHPDPIIHRAVIRILAEAYHRHPLETTRFLGIAGGALDSNDILDIKINQEPRIGRRQVSYLEWGRLGNHFLHTELARRGLYECVRGLLLEASFEDAARRSFRVLGLS